MLCGNKLKNTLFVVLVLCGASTSSFAKDCQVADPKAMNLAGMNADELKAIQEAAVDAEVSQVLLCTSEGERILPGQAKAAIAGLEAQRQQELGEIRGEMNAAQARLDSGVSQQEAQVYLQYLNLAPELISRQNEVTDQNISAIKAASGN
jgi:hypothetical protein